MSPSAPSSHEKRAFASEIKFLIDPALASRIREWARTHLSADPNARGELGDTYRVSSLYFDTPGFDVFRRAGRLRFSKFRVRRYNDTAVFLERKLKISGRVAKRRTPISTAELEHLAATSAAPAWPGLWFLQRTSARRLRPICQIDYARTARVLATPDGPIRLTLDEAIRAQPIRDPRFHDPAAAVAVTDRVVLELKFRRDLPVLFRELAARFTLNPVPFSKYRTAVQTLHLAPDPARASDSAGAPAFLTPAALACPTS